MKYFSWLWFMVLLLSCEKESTDISVDIIELDTDLDIRNMFFHNKDTVYICGGRLWSGGFIAQSIDGGNSYNLVENHWKIINGLAFNSQNIGLAGSFWGGYHHSSDGVTWDYNENYLLSSMNDVHFINDSIAVIPTGDSYYFGGYSRYNVFTRIHDYRNYEKSFACQYFFNENEGLFGAYGVIYKTNDGAQSVQATNATGDYFKDIEFNEAGEGLAIGYNGLILKSNNKGASWDRIDKKGKVFSIKGNLESLAVFDNIALIAGQDGVLYYSNDLGESWMNVNHPFDKTHFYKVVLTSNSTGYLAGANGLLARFVL